MGLILNVYRSDFVDSLAYFKDKKMLTLTEIIEYPYCETPPEFDCNVFEPTENRPECVLVWRVNKYRSNPFIRPVNPGQYSFGGSFAYTSDSRFSSLFSFYGAIPIHDRIEK